MLILVIGKNYSTGIFADTLAQNKENIIFTTAKCEIANYIDISPFNIDEIKDFIMANEISFLITVDKFCIDICYGDYLDDTECCAICADEFISKLCLNLPFAKKYAYKNKLLTSKFLIHEKYQNFLDYLNTAQFPISIMPEIINETQNVYIAETKDKAEKRGEELLLTGNRKILTEEYTDGIKYTQYYITDGIRHSFLFDTVSYFDEVSTNNTSYINNEVKEKIETQYVPCVFNDLLEEGADYLGILGFTFKIDKDNNVFFLNFKPFFDELDIEIFINTINEDIASLFYSCACGELQENISFNDKYAISCDIEGKIETFCSNTMNGAIKIAQYNGAEDILFEAIKNWKR